MPRAIWSGSISFGLVNVPVRMFSAIDENDLRFHLIHEPDGSRIGYQKICKTEDEPVPDEEIVKAFEFEKDEFVVLADEDFAAARSEGVKTIEISDFVPYDESDAIYFERTYYLGPQQGGERVYVLLRNAMEKTGLAAIAKYVMRDRQSLGCLRVREGTLTLEKMFFHDELRPVDEIAPTGIRIPKGELGLATSLIEQFTGSFEPERYEDTYREALCRVIKAKRKGETITAPEPDSDEEPTDLLAALKASVEAAKQTKSSRPATRSASRKPAARKRKAAKR
ncbi:MAG: Ku protein [Gaiellaceae bacterium MAG52_C11]|nr:Ku protein [Candidatus Gaiellasilicea maunaloa]